MASTDHLISTPLQPGGARAGGAVRRSGKVGLYGQPLSLVSFLIFAWLVVGAIFAVPGAVAATMQSEKTAAADAPLRSLSLQEPSTRDVGGLPRTIVPSDEPAPLPRYVPDALTRPVRSGAAGDPGAAAATGADGASNAATSPGPTVQGVLDSYLFVFVIAFLITLAITPAVRRFAEKTNIVDVPSTPRKEHRRPIAYLGGVAVFVGMLAGILSSYFIDGYDEGQSPVPINILLAMTAVMFTGLLDDIFSWDPNLKLGGQCFAAAALALDDDIGGRVADGLLRPLEAPLATLLGVAQVDLSAVPILPGSGDVTVDLIYWCGAAIIGIFVIGGCNAANLIDGLDGLLTGTSAVMTTGLLIICALLASATYGNLDGARIVVCYALLGACLGFLPHNFRPANIFLGDAGSLLIGFTIIVIILMLGEQGQTHLVFAGLIVFGLPILDATLAIIRRRMSGLPISHGDNNHLHHLLRRTRLGVVGSVFVLYGVSAAFAAIGVGLVFLRARWVYALGLVLAGFIIVTGIKAAERRRQAQKAAALAAASGAPGSAGGDMALPTGPSQVPAVSIGRSSGGNGLPGEPAGPASPSVPLSAPAPRADSAEVAAEVARSTSPGADGAGGDPASRSRAELAPASSSSSAMATAGGARAT